MLDMDQKELEKIKLSSSMTNRHDIYPYIGLHLKFANSAPVPQEADIPGSHRQTIGQVAPTV